MIPPDERPAWIETTLREAFQPDHLEVHDESRLHRGHPGAAAGGGHFRVTIVSDRFHGRPRIARHRMIYEALGEAMKTEIHALAVRAFTTKEWEKESPGG